MYRKVENSFFSTGEFCRTPAGLDLFSYYSSSTAASPNRDRGGIMFMDEIGGYTDGFVSCTESLGCESSDERITGDGLVEGRGGNEIGERSTIWGRAKRRSEERKRVVELPPPLTSFDTYGRRDFILRPVRKDGRLQLTEVKICRPEIMHATRENGRLTLRLVGAPEEEEQDDEVEEKKPEEAEDYDLNEEDGENSKADVSVDGGDCRSPASGGEGGEALRRCYEYEVAALAGQQHLNVWSPRFVATM
ncbi:hypothetical protein V2J09_008107 [Rumex salicifolius]